MAKIRAYEIKDYSFPFKKKLKLISTTLEKRDGSFLKVLLSDGSSQIAELAPFPTVHKETLSEARKELKKVMELHLNKDLSELEDFILNNKLASSVSFCLSQLVEDKLLSSDPSFIPKNSGLIQLDSVDLDLKDKNSFKIKLGREDFELEYEKLKDLSTRLPKDTKLRLDPNQSLKLDQMIKIIDLLSVERIEYLEDPFKDPSTCIELKHLYPNIKIALDETLWDLPIEDIPSFCDILIIKPTRFYSLHYLIDYIRKAKRDVILSSCYESARSLKSYQKICQKFSLHRDMGFGSYEWIEDLAYKGFNKNDYQLPENTMF